MQNYKGQEMEILKVKYNSSEGYIVNDTIIVPNAKGNRHYTMVQEWIANGGVVDPFETPSEIALREKNEANEAIKRELDELDKLSIRDIRAWIALQPDAPQMLKDREAQAVDARSRLQP